MPLFNTIKLYLNYRRATHKHIIFIFRRFPVDPISVCINPKCLWIEWHSHWMACIKSRRMLNRKTFMSSLATHWNTDGANHTLNCFSLHITKECTTKEMQTVPSISKDVIPYFVRNDFTKKKRICLLWHTFFFCWVKIMQKITAAGVITVFFSLRSSLFWLLLLLLLLLIRIQNEGKKNM